MKVNLSARYELCIDSCLNFIGDVDTKDCNKWDLYCRLR